jgi:chromosome segregation ATPase
MVGGEWKGRMEALEERLGAAEAEGRVAEELRMECRRLMAEKEGLKSQVEALEEELRQGRAQYAGVLAENEALEEGLNSGEAAQGDEEGDEEYRVVWLPVPAGSRVTIDVGPS